MAEKAKQAQEEYCNQKHIPMFALEYCHRCGHNIYDRDGYTLEYASSHHITSCPFCHASFCD